MKTICVRHSVKTRFDPPPPPPTDVGRIFFPIDAPGMGRFQLLNLGVLGYGLWVRVEVLGSDCNNRFPNTNHNLNHNSNDCLTLTPKSNPALTLTLTLY